ncbi:MAG TPA: hypothetical protein PLJ35_15045 [Anaerolineae bacterium]|nr:hypothetical protein [Anaerolineae bacterium]HOR00128.1 hypothetical protein [Anaerolineae bacterium]
MSASKDVELADFCMPQRAYLRALASMVVEGYYLATEIMRLASSVHGGSYEERSLLERVVLPLEHAGYVSLQLRSDENGVSRTVPLVSPTEKLIGEYVFPLLDHVERGAGKDLCLLLRRPLGDILACTKAPDGRSRGLALDALAIRLMVLLNLVYIDARVHGTATDGTMAQLLFESTSLLLSRWQVHCRNAEMVTLDDVATAVGLSYVLRSDVVVMVGMEAIEPRSQRFACEVMENSKLRIAMINRADLECVERAPSAIIDVLNRESRLVLARG